MPTHDPFNCLDPNCQYVSKSGGNYRDHVRKYHPEIDAKTLEKYMLMVRMPDLDLDAAIKDYLDAKESIWTLKKKGKRLARYFKIIGIRKKYGEEIKAHRFLLHGSYSPRDNPNWVKSMMERHGTLNSTKLPSVLEKRSLNILKKEGLEELLDATLVLRKLKKLRRAKAKELREAESAKTEAENTEIT